MKPQILERSAVGATLLTALCALPSPGANAQGEARPEMEELIVVGRQLGYYDSESSSALRQLAPTLETPASVLVINSELIADQQSFRLDQILQNDASVQKSNNFLGAYSSFTVRGFELSNGSNYLRDGRVYFQLAAPPTETLERVEVLKGPASVLYGTLAPGGLINMVSKRPTQETTGFIKATVGTDDLTHVHADVGGAVAGSDSLRYRLNVVREESEYFREFFDGSDFEVDREVYAAAFEWDITDNTNFFINADYLDDDRPQDNGVIADEEGRILDSLDYELIYNQPWTHYNSEVSNVYALITHRFNADWLLKVGYSYQDFERDRYDNQPLGFNDETGGYNLLARRRLNRRDYETLSFDLNGQFETGPVTHKVLLGAEQTDIDRNDRENSPLEQVILRANVFEPALPNPGIGFGSVKVEGDEERQGIFIQDLVEIGERWRVLLGARYDDYDTTLAQDYDTDNLTPRFGVLYLPRENLSLYGSYSESFEPQPPVPPGFENAGADLDPIEGEMIELGAKWELYDGNLLLTGAAFVIERTGDTIEDIAQNILQQRGKQEHRGVELAMTGLIGDNLSIVSSFTYLDAEFKENDDPDLVGNTPFGVADYSFSLWAEYQFNDGWARGLSLQAGAFYESSRPVSDQNEFDFDSYTRYDIGAKYAFELPNGHGVITRITVSNLTDEEYFKASTRFAIAPERLREVRGSVQYTF